jgi:hypothetical protein
MKNFFKATQIHKDLLVFSFLGVLVLLKFWNFLIPWDKIYMISDFPELMPLREFFYRHLREGQLVLWDSHLGTGLPYLSADFGAFYPPDLLVGLLANFYNIDRLQVQMVLHFWLAGIFAYGYTRQQGLPRFSAAVSGLCFMLGGFLLSHAHHRNIIQTFIWLPLILFSLDQALRRRKIFWAMAAGLCLSISFLAGNANFFYYILLFISLYYLFRLGSLLREKAWRRAWAETGYFMTAGLFLIGFSAVQWLPMLSSTLASSQADASFAWKVQGSFSIMHLIHLLTPILWASRDASEDFAYLGLLPLLLGCWAGLAAKEKIVHFFSLTALFGLLLALGENTPLFKIFYDTLPGLQLFRIPSRGIALTAFSLAVLAGFGCHYLIQQARRREIAALARALRTLFFFSLGAGLLAYCFWFFLRFLPVEAVQKNQVLWADLLTRYTFYLLLSGASYLIVAGRRRDFPAARLKAALILLISLDLLIVNLNFGPDVGQGTRLSYQDPARIPRYSQAIAGELKKEPAPFRISDPEGLVVLNTIYQEDFSVVDLDRVPGYVARFMPPEYTHLAEASRSNPYLSDLLNLTFAFRPRRPVWQEDILPLKISRRISGPRVYPARTIEIEPTAIQSLGLNSLLGDSARVPQGQTVAEIIFSYRDGQQEVLPLRAGVETAEWTIDDPEGKVAHRKPPVAQSWAQDDGRYQGHSFEARLRPLRNEKIEKMTIAGRHPEGILEIKDISLNDQPLAAFLIQRLEPLVPPELFRNKLACPRAFMIARARAAATPAQALEEIQKLNFNPRESVIIPALPPGYREPADSGYAPREVRIEAYGPRQVRLTTQAGQDKFLVLSEAYSPYWRAVVDGRPAPVLRANYGLRAVFVPRGRHEVSFVFSYPPFYRGLGITAVTLAAFVLTLLITRRRKSVAAPPQEAS